MLKKFFKKIQKEQRNIKIEKQNQFTIKKYYLKIKAL